MYDPPTGTDLAGKRFVNRVIQKDQYTVSLRKIHIQDDAGGSMHRVIHKDPYRGSFRRIRIKFH